MFFNSLSSSFTNFHRKITSKPFFQNTLNNQKLPPFTTFNHFELLFNLLDSNGDGKISPKELGQFFHRLGYKKLKAQKEAREMVKEMDSDHYEFTDMDDFLEIFKGDGEEDHYVHLMEAFLIFDGDKNGLICAEELRRTLSDDDIDSNSADNGLEIAGYTGCQLSYVWFGKSSLVKWLSS